MATSRDLFILTSPLFSIRTSVLKDGYSFSKSAKFEQTEIMNRSSPILTYSSPSPIVFQIAFDLVAPQSDATEVVQVVQSLTSLTFPVQPGVKPPPLCQITCGTILNGWACVCEDVDNHMGGYGVWDVNANNPMNAV